MDQSVSVTVEELNTTERLLRVRVEPQEVATAMANALVDVQKQVAIKGYRKGKAPAQVVKRMYAGQIESEAINQLLNNSYGYALSQVKLRIISRPVIQDLDFGDGKPFSYSAKIEILPDVEVKKYKGLQIETVDETVTDDLLQTQIDRVRESRAELVPVAEARPVKTGDFVTIDCTGSFEDRLIQELTGDQLELEVGAGRAFPGLEEKLVGMTLDQSEKMELTYPEGHESEFSGKPVSLEVKIRGLKEKVLPTWNDDFAKDVGNYQTIKDLEDFLKKQLASALAERAHAVSRQNLVTALVDANSFEVPPSLVSEERERMLDEVRQDMKQRGVNIDDQDPVWKELHADYQDKAMKRVQGGILLDAVAKKEGFTVEPADVERYYQSLAERSGRPIEEVKRFYQSGNREDSIDLKVLEEKTLEFLYGQAKITKKVKPSET